MRVRMVVGMLGAALLSALACVPARSPETPTIQSEERASKVERIPLRSLLALENEAYRDARTALLAQNDVQDEIDDFAPVNTEERMLKRAIQGWVDNEAEYAAVLPALLADEENGRTIDGEGFIGDSMRRPSRRGKIFRVAPNVVLDEPVLILARMMELFLFEQDNLETKTTLLPLPDDDWRFGRINLVATRAYKAAYSPTEPLVAIQDLVDDTVSILLQDLLQPLDSSGHMAGHFVGLPSLEFHVGTVAIHAHYKSRWTHTSPIVRAGKTEDLRWYYYLGWKELGRILLHKNLITEADMDETGLTIPERPILR